MATTSCPVQDYHLVLYKTNTLNLPYLHAIKINRIRYKYKEDELIQYGNQYLSRAGNVNRNLWPPHFLI